MDGLERLAGQLARLAQQAGAGSASIYLPTPWNAVTPVVLVHAGEAAPLPELATAPAAEAFASEVLDTGAWHGMPVGTDGLVPSHGGQGVLIAAPLLTSLWAGAGSPTASHTARRRRSDAPRQSPAAGWVGLRMPTLPGGSAGSMMAVAHALAATIVGVYSVLTDPLTGLPGRPELMGVLRADLDRARRRRVPCALALVNPLGLDVVNDDYGRRTGDALIREVVVAIHGLLRRSDVLMRYGGAIFALPLGNVGADAAMLVAERVRRHVTERAFLHDTVRLRCAVGVAVCEADEADGFEPIDLLKRANEALGAARRGDGDAIATWHDSNAAAPATDRLLGVFTGNTDRDYRNMGLLWDVLQALSGASGSTDLAAKVVDRLVAVLRPARASFFAAGDAGARMIFGRKRHGDAADGVLQPDDVVEDERAVVTLALDAGAVRQRPFQLTMPDGAHRAHVAIAVPLVTGGRALGAICLVGNPDAFDLDRTDLHVLTGLAGPLAVALDREQLAERDRVRAEHERRRLQAEVHELRTQKNPIVFQSPVMADVLARVRRIASTEATVLVTGESGTGKEMLAQTVHQLSGRRARPFVIVDCGAIPATLIDSELFGHERGAFTGAQQRASGRLAMADGGTVFLDEVGELPLDVQSRLLRFVQEKTISMVGGTRARKVDVRIVAATNRLLEEEVRAGRFREDLFYRLNVVRLHVPPLRERPEDIVLLAAHFARAAAGEHHKPIKGFTAAAEQRLIDHHWPGNIRELQNTILQAVVLSEGDRLDESDLTLPAAPGRRLAVRPSSPGGGSSGAGATAGALGYREAWHQLRLTLDREVQRAAAANPRMIVPIGRWLAHEVVLVAHEQAGRNGVRAAARVGLPQTTFARRLRNAQSDRGLSTRPPTWNEVTAALGLVVGAADLPSEGFADRTEALLFDAVFACAPTPIAYAAALMGLSPPTLKQRLVAREAS